MEGGQSTEVEGTEFHSDSNPNNEKGNSLKTSAGGKECFEEKADCRPSTSKQNENMSQHTLHSNIEKLQTECKDNMPGKSNRNSFNEASSESEISSLPKLDKVVFDETVYKSKDNHSRIFLSVISDDSDSEENVYFAQVSRPVFYHEDFSEDRDNLTLITNPSVSDLESLTTELESPLHEFIKTGTGEISSETKKSSPVISSLVVPGESISENETNLTRSSLEVSDKIGLQEKFGSLQISNPVKLDETASENNTNLFPLSSHIRETASEISPFSFVSTSLHKNVSRNSGNLSSKETKLLFKLPEMSIKSKKEQMKIFRKQRYHLPSKDNQSKAYDFKAFSQSQTGNKQFEWKSNPFEISGTTIPEEIVSDTNDSLSQIFRPKVHDVNASESKQKLSDIFKFGVSDETSLENKFSSFHTSKHASPEKTASDNNSGLFNISRPITFGADYSLNSVTRLNAIKCINSILRRDSLQESEWLVNSQEASISKNTRKRKREPRNYHSVPPSDTLEIQVKCEDKSTQTRKNLVADDNASGSASFTPERDTFGDLDEETLRSIRTLLSDCLSWLSNISGNNLRSKDATNQKKELRNLKKSKSLASESSPRIHQKDERKDATNQSKSTPESSSRIHQKDERSNDTINQKKELRNQRKSKSPPSESSPRIHQKDESNPSAIKISPASKSNQMAKSLQSGADSNNIDNSKLQANIPQTQDVSVEHNQNSCNLSTNSSLNQNRQLMDRFTRSRSTTSGQHQSIFFELDGKYIEILVSKKPLRTKTTENDSSNSNAENTREINRNQSWIDTSKTENSDNKNRFHFDSIKGDNSQSNRNRFQSHSSKADNSGEHGLEIFVSENPLRTKISENESSNSNAENTKEFNRNQSWTDNSKTEIKGNRNLCNFDSFKGSDNESNRNRPKSHSSKADNSDKHGLEIKTGSFQTSNTVNLAETPSENTNLLPVSNLMFSSESGSEMFLLPVTGTLIYENSSTNTESVSSDGTELLFKLPEKSTRNRRQKKNTVRIQRHQLRVPPKDNLTKTYIKPFSQTHTESIPFEWKLNSFQISGSTIPEETTSDIKESIDQISNLTVPDETNSGIKHSLGQSSFPLPVQTISGIEDSLCQTSSSTVLDETASEKNENLTYENSSRNTESVFPDGTELLFKLPEKSTRNRREQKNAVRKQRYQLSSPPKDSQNKAYDFKPFPQTYTETIPFEWKLSSFQIPGSTIPGESISNIKENLGQISNSTVSEETTSYIKDNLGQISSSTVLTQISDSTIPLETTSDVKDSLGQTSSSTVVDETSSESNENLTNKSMPEISDPSLENKFSHLHVTSSVNPDEPASDKNSGLPRTSRPTNPEDGDFLNPVVPLKIASYRAMNRNMSQSNSRKIDSNETNNDNLSEWLTLFSIDTDESSEIWDIFTAMFVQLLVFTATEYVYEFFNFIFFLFLIFIAVTSILYSSGFIFYHGPFHSL